jgi:hypothetical protein
MFHHFFVISNFEYTKAFPAIAVQIDSHCHSFSPSQLLFFILDQPCVSLRAVIASQKNLIYPSNVMASLWGQDI